MKHIVLGAGPAGVTACQTIRQLDATAAITLVGDEPEAPYGRMAIPYLLAEQIDETGTHLRRAESFYADNEIEVVRAAATSVDPAGGTVSLGSETRDFDRLLIATGARPVMPPITGIDTPGVHSCWTLADAREIIAAASAGARVVVIGAGFIASTILEALGSRQVELTVIEREDRVVPRMMDHTAGAMLGRWCEAKGVTVLTATEVRTIEGSGSELSLTLDGGDRLTAQLVIVATGVKANIDFLGGAGIETGQGILVDRHLETNREGVFAAGDVAEGRDFSTGGRSVQAIQPTAVEHARIAAANMVSAGSVSHRGSLNMNILDTFGLVSASFGRWMGVDGGDSATLLDEDNFRYLNLQFTDDRLVGASAVGHTEHIGVVRGLITSQANLGKWKQRLVANPLCLMEAYLGVVQGLA